MALLEGDTMNLLYPQLLWLFVPLLALWYYRRPLTLHQRIHWSILALLLLALTRPQMQKGIRETTVKARDIIIALDVSYSMRAQDIRPDRYTFAKETIEALLRRNARDNMMLIAFTTNPLLLSPPTTDHAVIATTLQALDRDNILTKGTSLHNLFAKIAALPKRKRELLLITDGGEEQELQTLTEPLGSTPVHLTILAMGTTQGATVPKADGTTLTNANGELVVSRINPLLSSLAQALDGAYIEAQKTPEATAEAIEKAFDTTQNSTHTVTKKHYHTTELYAIPLLIALILFLALHTRVWKYLLLLLALAGIPVQASWFERYTLHNAYDAYQKKDYNLSAALLQQITTPSLQRRYALASVCYKQGHYQKALTLYRSIKTRSVPMKQRLFYNIANTYAHLKAYDKAKIYYTKTLQLGKDADALHNLRLIVNLQTKQTPKGHTLPKPQGGNGASGTMSDTKKQHNGEQSRSGSGAGGQSRQKSKEDLSKKGRLIMDDISPKQPLGSKVYELINKGYIRETQPW